MTPTVAAPRRDSMARQLRKGMTPPETTHAGGPTGVPDSTARIRHHAVTIWQAAVDAVRPSRLIHDALAGSDEALSDALGAAERILVVGGGKAAGAMAVAVEAELAELLARIEGVVNVPGPASTLAGRTRRIRLHAARPPGSNHPTTHGVAGATEMLALVRQAGPDDVCLCLLSGGGSALLPAPADGITLADKQEVTRLLHECGATINEMNTVRKHLSRIKGGGLAAAFTGRLLVSLIISDVIGDPLDVIASGPTAPDLTTFADALTVLRKHDLISRVPPSVLHRLEQGAVGTISETPKTLPQNVQNRVIGSNHLALAAASRQARELGYSVLNLGPCIEGETRDVALVHAGIVRAIRQHGVPVSRPACVLSGGETTVTLGPQHGLGGRNQEFVLSAVHHLGLAELAGVVILSGGTDGEDGPTDAAGAVADELNWIKAAELGLSPAEHLARHDAYHFLGPIQALFKTGLTETNVMDVRVILIE
jgi:hydroxypyruvate reductase/glycerate 2-kinase